MTDQELNDRSWSGNYWGWNGALWLELAKHRKKLSYRPQDWSAMSGIASAYYSAAGDALARLWTQWWFAPFWALIGLWCAERAIWWSNRVWDNIPHNEMTAEICDVRQSICRKVSKFLPWRREYLHYAGLAVDNGIFLVGRGAAHAPHTRPLLLIGRADIMLRTGEERAKALAVLNEICELAFAVVGRLLHQSTFPVVVEEQRQYARIFCGLVRLYRELGEKPRAKGCHQMMLQLARYSGATDQILKASV